MLRNHLHQIATDRGCVGFGVTTAGPFAGVAADMAARKAAGLAADLAFTYKAPAVAADVRRSFPWAERIVAVAFPYLPDAGAAHPAPGTMRIARFADGDHYRGLRHALDGIADGLTAGGYRAEVLTDDARLVDRAAAVRAGIAWWGKSSMALVPGAGPWVLLGSVVTDAPLDVDTPGNRSCGTCTACIPACPTGAILDEGIIDVRRCLAYVLQTSGVVPYELRDAVGDRLYGCDDCLTSCPPGTRLLDRTPASTGPEIVDVLRASDEELLERYGHFYLPDRRPRILRRNALIAAGNDRSPSLEPVVIGYAGHPDWMLRVHAVWAIGRFDTRFGAAALAAALSTETDDRVRDEIRLAAARSTIRPGLR